MEQTECSEMSAYKIQMSGNYPEENLQHTEHDESLKSRGNLHIGLHLPVNVCMGQFIIHFKYHSTEATSTVFPTA